MRIGYIGIWTRQLGVALVCLVLPSSVLGEAALQGTRIRATYDVGVAAIDLGTFDMTATVNRDAYALKANGAFSILGGLLYRADGTIESNGVRASATSKPQHFDFTYSDNKKTQQLQIFFNRGSVRQVTRKPKKRPDRKAVPLSNDQLRNVLDPATAAFLAISANLPAGDTAVCNGTLRIFDGKRLFELTLSPKRTAELGARAPDGLRTAAVCAVRYTPIGGHRAESSTVAFLQKSKDIEAWLVPVPGTQLFVPYKVVVPTAWGNGTVTLTQLEAGAAAPRRASAR
ncbi:DUF3108 domain-containing protein [Methyloceanibacter methanicus]|nr:DUF3108 domain-containing protein [Methyloceanibacter methanicus]